MIVTKDRVIETSTTTGTGDFTLEGALAGGFQTFLTGVGNGNECWYTITDGADWETGRGTITIGGTDTLSRDTVLDSSNGGALVDFPVGTKQVSTTVPGALIAGAQQSEINARQIVGHALEALLVRGTPGAPGVPLTLLAYIETLLSAGNDTAACAAIGAARLAAIQTFTGANTFDNVAAAFLAGLVTDNIGEQTSAAGVTIDGLTLKDSGFALGSDATLDMYYRLATGALGRIPAGNPLEFLRINAAGTNFEYAASLRASAELAVFNETGGAAPAWAGVTNEISAVAHGLSAEPDWVVLVLECVNTSAGYAPGDRQEISAFYKSQNASNQYHVMKDATNITVYHTYNSANFGQLSHKTTGAVTIINKADWKVLATCYKLG